MYINNYLYLYGYEFTRYKTYNIDLHSTDSDTQTNSFCLLSDEEIFRFGADRRIEKIVRLFKIDVKEL